MKKENQNIEEDKPKLDNHEDAEYLSQRCVELEKLLTQKNEFLQFISNNSSDVLWKVDKKYKFDFISPQIEVQRGFSPDELIGKNLWEHVGPSTLKLLRDGEINLFDYQSIIDIVGSGPLEFELLCKNGSAIMCNVYLQPFFDQKGEFDGFYGLTKNINNVQIDKRYAINDELLKIVVRNADVLIFILDKEGKIVLSEGKALELFKLLPNQIAGLSIFDIFEDNEQIRTSFNSSLKGAVTDSKVYIQDYIFEIKFSPYDTVRGASTGVVAIATDVTARINDERERERLIEELQISRETIAQEAGKLVRLNDFILDSEETLKRNNAEKDKFISVISHDLRSPFGGLIGLSENMLNYFEDYSQADIKESLGLIVDSSKRMYKLLDNLLLWARLNRGVAEFSPEKLDLIEKIRENIEIQSLNAQNKNVSIKLIEAFPILVYADGNMVDAVLRNLISNAVKFSNPGGEIIIGTRIIEDIFAEVYIKDFGVGISQADQDKLFRLDSHYSNIGTANETGTGLGLILCKEMLEKTGGTIKLHSELGKGSEFSFTLPFYSINS